MLLVGHEPDFSAEVGRLTGAKVAMKKGGIAVVDGSTLVALLRPKELRRIAGGLTEKGERQARDAGLALAGLGVRGSSACLASPKVRAVETARIACEALGVEVEITEALRGVGRSMRSIWWPGAGRCCWSGTSRTSPPRSGG